MSIVGYMVSVYLQATHTKQESQQKQRKIYFAHIVTVCLLELPLPIQFHPDIKVHGANMGPIWGRQEPGGPHVGPMNLAIWAILLTKYI